MALLSKEQSLSQHGSSVATVLGVQQELEQQQY
jgi:hypothetical protein